VKRAALRFRLEALPWTPLRRESMEQEQSAA